MRYESRHVTSPNTVPPRSEACGHHHRTASAAERCSAKQRQIWRHRQGRATLPDQWIQEIKNAH